MLELYDSIFADGFADVKRPAYARLHRMLAGSFCHSWSLRAVPNYAAHLYYR